MLRAPMMVRGLAALAVAGLAVTNLPAAWADTSPLPGDPETVTASPLPTWQTNGTVWSMEIVNNVAYVGGNFTAVRPPGSPVGQGEVERRHLAAFDTKTGDLLPWAPRLTSPVTTVTSNPDVNCTSLGNNQYECASVFSVRVSPDQKTLFAGGDFQAVDGKSRPAVAAFNLPDGTLDTVFKPLVAGGVKAIAPTDTQVFLGGNFTKVSGQVRSRLGALDYKANTLLPWAPTADKTVTSMVLAPDKSRVVIGGKFDLLNGVARHGIGGVFTSDAGASSPWSGDQMASVAFTTSLMVHDGLVYVTGDARGSVSEGIQAVDPNTGATVWSDYCRGASQSSAWVRGAVYVGSHAHDCGGAVDGWGEQYQGYPSDDGNRYKLRAVVPFGDGRGKILHWFPHTDDGNGPRAMATDQNILWMGGEFTLLNDKISQQGLTRYSFKDQGAANLPPLKPSTPIAGAVSAERVNVSWPATHDLDNRHLQYLLIRNDDIAHPIFTVESDGRPWAEPWMSYVDTNVTAGQTYSYTVRAVDPDGGQSIRSGAASVTVPANDIAAKDLAVADGAVLNYHFDETSGNTVASSVGGRTAAKGLLARLGQPGILGNGISLPGSASGVLVDGTKAYAKRSNSVETMFKTSTRSGGVLLSVGASSSTTSVSTDDRNVLYMTSDGRLSFGEKPDTFSLVNGPANSQQSVSTTGSYNDNAWHHVVATFEPGTGVSIYVDGSLVARDSAIYWSRSMNGCFRIGADKTSGWPNRPSSDWWAGSLDEVAAYDYPLSAAQVATHANAMLSRPTAPTGLAGHSTGPSGVDLAWNAVAGATDYNVYRDGVKIMAVTSTSASDTALKASTAYSYAVSARNAHGDEGGKSNSVSITTAAPPPAQLLQSGSVWSYETSGVETPNWKSAAFDDSAWGRGPSQLGHGEADEATVLTPFGADGATRRITTYFRSDFTVASAADIKQLAMKLKRDDGIIIYLNGVEVYRELMPAGDVTADTLASTFAPDDGQNWLTRTLSTSALVDGKNTITVEIHQNARSSLDLSFDLDLMGIS